MDVNFAKQYIAVIPEKEEENNIKGNKEIERYIYKTIISKPNEDLLQQINNITKKVCISGIITRGSLAHFLYKSKVSVPIFDLQFAITSLLKNFENCSIKKYKKICIFEIGSQHKKEIADTLSFHAHMDDYEFYYYKVFDNSAIEPIINDMAKNKSVDVIIGDVEPAQIAQKYNIPIERIRIGRDSWKEAINSALHSSEITMKSKSKNNFIEIITNIVSEAVVIFDSFGNIKRCNLQAEKLFSKVESGHNIETILNIKIQDILLIPANTVFKIQDCNYVINLIPVILDNEQLYSIIINNVKYVENLEMSIRTQNKEKGLNAKYFFENIIANDPKTKKIVSISKKYAKSNSTIIIYGESGTGKEVFASSLHNESLRSHGPFVAINCASFNENLIESELFGYEKGAFTGALNSGKKGLFEIAHKGTLFLDEIGELPLNLQAKILRVIQEKEIMRIGGDKIIPIDVRFISATNKNLKKLVNAKQFREDLYYRLALLEIDLPPLRERILDIIPLFTYFLTKFAEQENKSIFWNDINVFNALFEYDWPGNIRELKNFAERVVILSDANKIAREFINEMIHDKFDLDSIPTYTCALTNDLKEFESRYVNFLLHKYGNNKDKLCEYLNISKSTLWRKLNNS